jgi:cell division protein FtsZ
MSGAGSALMGIGSARGEGRAVQAAGKAINSPLLEASMDGAHGVLLSIAGGSDLGLFEINEAASLVQESAHPDANIIFGTVIDDSLGDEVRVTVIAAGFDSGGPTHKKLEPTAVAPRGPMAAGQAGQVNRPPLQQPPRQPGAPPSQPGRMAAQGFSANSNANGNGNGMHPARGGTPVPGVGRPGRAVTVTDLEDDVDVPPFMKR